MKTINLSFYICKDDICRGEGSIRVKQNQAREVNSQNKLRDQFSFLSQAGDSSGLYSLNPAVLSQIQSFLDDPKIPEQRKSGILAQIIGMSSNFHEASSLDGLSEGIIGTSNRQKALNKLATDIGGLLNQVSQTDYQEGYDSANAQNARELDAGINPQVLQNVDAGQSADFDDQSLNIPSPLGSEIDPLHALTGVASTIVSVFSGCASFITGIQGVVKNGLELDIMSNELSSSDSSLIEDAVSRSGLYPSSAMSLDDGFLDDGTPISFKDDKGNFIPFDKLSKEQKNTLQFLADSHNADMKSEDAFKIMFGNYGFSKKKMNRLYRKYSDYLSSPVFLRNYYENMAGFRLSQKQMQSVQEDAGFHAFDNLATGLVRALSKSQYSEMTDENIFKSETYRELINNGIPKEEALKRSREIFRDEADNKVLDDFRSYLLDVVDGYEIDEKTGKKVKKSYDKWDVLTAKVGLILLFLVRNGSSVSGNVGSLINLIK